MSDTAGTWEKLRAQYEVLGKQLVSPGLENAQRGALQREYARIGGLLEAYDAVGAIERERQDLQQQCDASTDEMFKELCKEEFQQLDERHRAASAQLEELLYPPDELDDRSVFLEIRAGTGGQEAALFAGDLLRMYMMYALKQGWQTSLIDESGTDLGGYREVVLSIKGKGVYGQLKRESGVHRVQRVPKTESSGRIHTSTATVAVLPEAEDVDVTIDPNEIRIDTFCAGGAGGQHVNKTESAIRITHIPTGIVVSCQDERSQHKNKNKAMKVLQARIFAHQKEKTDTEQSQKRREMVGSGERSEKVRTYNYPQNRVTDHQVDLTLQKLDIIMKGELTEIVQALMHKERQERRERVQRSVAN
jgi:peptide chain release factor 1